MNFASEGNLRLQRNRALLKKRKLLHKQPHHQHGGVSPLGKVDYKDLKAWRKRRRLRFRRGQVITAIIFLSILAVALLLILL